MHFCPGNFLHPKTSHTLHVDPESKNAAHTKYLDPIPKTLKRSQLSQEFWRRWHMGSKKATQLVHYTLLLCIFVLAHLCNSGQEDPPSVTRCRFVTAAWLSCQWWGKTVKPNLFTAAVTLYLGNELSLALNKDIAQAEVISSHSFSTEFQCWFSTQESPIVKNKAICIKIRDIHNVQFNSIWDVSLHWCLNMWDRSTSVSVYQRGRDKSGAV